MVYLDYPTGNLKRMANVQLLYNNGKVQKQCTDLKIAKKLFGGNAALATSLFARINAMQQASVIKDIVMMPTFHFHKLFVCSLCVLRGLLSSLFLSSQPSPFVPDGFQWSLFVLRQPPFTELYLQ